MRDLELMTELVDLLSDAPDFVTAATALAQWARDSTGCESTFVRMQQTGVGSRTWLPIVAASGSRHAYLRDEAIVDDLECACGRVATGDVDIAQPYHTEEGSFFWGRLGSIARECPGTSPAPRGRCITEGFESIAIVPLLGPKGTIGCIHLADSRPDLFEPMQELLEAAGRVSGKMLLGHRVQDAERAALESISEALMPIDPPVVSGLELGVCSAQAEELVSVGGDFYDVFTLPDDKIALVAGDYSGKGIDAVGTAARIRHGLATLASSAHDPAFFLTQANDLLTPLLAQEERFASAVCCTIDLRAGAVRVGLAGHPAPLRLRPSEALELDAPHNLPLGAAQGTRYEDASFTFGESDLLLLYTDGVTECRTDGTLFGVEGVIRVVSELGTSSLSDVACSVIAACAAHHDPLLPEDDRLVLVARLPLS